MDSVKEKLNNLEKKGQEFRQEGKLLEALDLMEEALNMKRAYFGAESDEYIESQERVAELSNVIALFYLQKGRAEVCLEYLKKAENISWNRPKYRAITNNNFACFYRKRGKFRVALNYLEQALKIEKTLENQKDLADTHLNLCAILSQLGQHTDALEHVLTAIMLLQDDLIYTQQTIDENTHRAEKISALVVAYHNLAVEYEYMKRFDDAQKTFERALRLSEKHFGENHYLYKNLTRIVSGGSGTGAGSQATFKATGSQINRFEPKMSVNTISSTQAHRINVVRRPQSAAIVDTAKVVKLKNVYSPKIKPPQSAGHNYPTIGLAKKPSTGKLTADIPSHPQSHKPSITIPPHREGRHERQDKNSLSPIEKRNDVTDKSFGFEDHHLAGDKHGGKQVKYKHDKADDSLDFNSFDDEAKLD